MTRARILLVEDAPLSMELATDILDAAGFAVVQASTAEQALDVARTDPPDLILMDIRLPRMGGNAAVQILKADPATRHIPTIALTAQAMRGDDQAARDAGFDGYITKPINTRTFAATVAGFLSDGSAP